MRLINCLFFLLFFSSASFGQVINGTVIASGKEGEYPAAYVNVFIFNRKKDKVSQGKTNGDGSFRMHPGGGYRFVDTEKYTILIEPDPLQKSLGGETVKRTLKKVRGSELNNVEVKVTAVGGVKSHVKAPNHLRDNPRLEDK